MILVILVMSLLFIDLTGSGNIIAPTKQDGGRNARLTFTWSFV